MIWVTMHPGVDLGFLPGFFEDDDPRPCREQIAERYVSGWSPMQGCSIRDGGRFMTYPGDPPYRPLATSVLREETLILYEHDFLAIIQPDGAFEVSRVD